MNRRTFISGIVLAGISAEALAGEGPVLRCDEKVNHSPKVDDSIAPAVCEAAILFRLDEVRLSDGPLKNQQESNRGYRSSGITIKDTPSIGKFRRKCRRGMAGRCSLTLGNANVAQSMVVLTCTSADRTLSALPVIYQTPPRP